MTTRTPRATAGIFVVRDPDVCAAVDALLAPHYTGPAPGTDAGARAADELMTKAIAHAAHITNKPADSWSPTSTPIEFLLDHTYSVGHTAGRKESDTEHRNRNESLAAALARTESDLARAEKHVGEANDQLREALAKIAKLEADLAKTTPAASGRAKPRTQDRQAFESLAQRMEHNALSQPKNIADVLRLSARAVRDEIDNVYGDGKKAS